MQIDENWAVDSRRISDFFREQTDVTELENGFGFRGCTIMLTPIPPAGSGFLDMPRTLVRMDGPEEDLKLIYRRFFLRFLSAGG